MISSRRLAREWALKILYQKDVGKVPLQEALDTALERLRLEFVQRGSRTASGSTVEQSSLDVVTSDLRDVLPGLRRPMESALAAVSARLLGEASYWQEVRIDRLFREPASVLPPATSRRLLMRYVAAAFGLPEGDIAGLPALQPPRLLKPLPEEAALPSPGPASESPSDPLIEILAQLTLEERARLTRFAHQIREELPLRLDEYFRLTGVAFVRETVTRRPAATLSHSDLQAYLRARREAFNLTQAERWQKVGAIIEKQTSDWLRTADFAVRLVQGVVAQQKEIDAAIAALSAGWHMDRQVAVDRNILRLGGYEMLYLEGVPTAASINEAVELAKKYSTTESGRFVNGVLGALAAQTGSKLDHARAQSSAAGSAHHAEPDDLPDDLFDLPDDMLDLGDDMADELEMEESASDESEFDGATAQSGEEVATESGEVKK